MTTGLTESEKESLLKFFLCQGGLTQNSNDQYSWKFYKDYTFLPFEENLVKIIVKAMQNLQLSAMLSLGFGEKEKNDETNEGKIRQERIAGNDAICEVVDEMPLMQEEFRLNGKLLELLEEAKKDKAKKLLKVFERFSDNLTEDEKIEIIYNELNTLNV